MSDNKNLEDEELNSLISTYYYDFNQWDSPFEDVTKEQELIEDAHQESLRALKSVAPAYFKSLKEKLQTEMFDRLFSVYQAPSNNLLSLLKTKPAQKTNSEKTLIQASIMFKDDVFVEFMKSFPDRLVEYFEE